MEQLAALDLKVLGDIRAEGRLNHIENETASTTFCNVKEVHNESGKKRTFSLTIRVKKV